MSDRPKPPDGYKLWLDFFVAFDRKTIWAEQILAVARAELAELRAKAAKWDALCKYEGGKWVAGFEAMRQQGGI